MSDSAEEGWEKLGLAAALAKTYAADQRDFLPLLTTLLEDAIPPDQLMVQRKPVRLFSSEKRVVLLELTLDDDVFVLKVAADGHRLEATHRKVVRGITLKTEITPVESWLRIVGERIQLSAERNEKVYFALQNFMELKNL